MTESSAREVAEARLARETGSTCSVASDSTMAESDGEKVDADIEATDLVEGWLVRDVVWVGALQAMAGAALVSAGGDSAWLLRDDSRTGIVIVEFHHHVTPKERDVWRAVGAIAPCP